MDITTVLWVSLRMTIKFTDAEIKTFFFSIISENFEPFFKLYPRIETRKDGKEYMFVDEVKVAFNSTR